MKPRSSSSVGALTRRQFLAAGGLVLAGRWLPVLRPYLSIALVEMRSDDEGSTVWFDPLGLRIRPGTTVRWVVRQNVHTTTAYHPRNDHHPLRIPPGTEPWDSGYLINPGASFEVTLTRPGVYDYFCRPHEAAGMVGRIVVGDGGAGAVPVGPGDGLPDAARQALPPVDSILRSGLIRRKG